MRTFTVMIIICFLLSQNGLSQHPDATVSDTAMWLKIEPEALNTDGSFKNITIDSIFTGLDSQRVRPVFDFVDNPYYNSFYSISFPSTNVDSLKSIIQLLDSNIKVVLLEYDEAKPMHDPSDYFWSQTTGVSGPYHWALKRIDAEYAWDITKGSPDIKIAILDTDFDVTHPDLASKISPYNDPWSGIPLGSDFHGTAVAGHAAAETAENGATAEGNYASIGFKTKLICYHGAVQGAGERANYMARVLHAATVMDADIITSSIHRGCNIPNDPIIADLEERIVQDVLDMGIPIVFPSGNGHLGANCGNVTNGWEPIYPFHPDYDERVIIVGGTTKDDNHYFEEGSTIKTLSDFPQIDLCAPSYEMFHCTPYDNGQNPFPYLTGGHGTSFAAPMVAGTVALLMSLNPCLTPAAIQDILISTTDPIVDASTYTFNGVSHVGTGRVNAYAAVQAVSSYGTSQAPVSVPTTWNDRRFFSQDVIVNSGSTLTLGSSAELWFSEGNRLIVEKGAKLIIDGARLTSRCLWGGIEIEGDATESQYYSGTYNPDQGIVEIKNGAVIEHANYGVYVKSGGILKVTDATFRNNYRGVHFAPYVFNIPNTQAFAPNISRFKNSTFITDDEIGPYQSQEYHLGMTYVHGIQINGCTFENTLPVGDFNRGKGIYAEAAGFNVTGICSAVTQGNCPPQNLQKSVFQGLEYGVFYLDWGGLAFKPDVRDTEFKCRYGMYVSGDDYTKVARCNFDLSDAFTLDNNPERYGLYLDGCSKYSIYDNDFSNGEDASSDLTVGIVVNNSGPEHNSVLGNRFTGLYHGIEALGNNLGQYATTEGFQFYCNEFSSTRHDVLVHCGTSFGGQPIEPAPCGIGSYIGVSHPSSIIQPAGNEFTHSCSSQKAYFDVIDDFMPCQYDILNQSQNHITYSHHDPAQNANVEPLYNPSQPISLVNTSTVWGSCAVKIPGSYPVEQHARESGSGIIGVPGETDLRSSLQNANSNLATLEQNYSSKLDNGNTSGLLSDAIALTSSNASSFHSSLMSLAPFVSNDVVVALIENETAYSETYLLQLLDSNSTSMHNSSVHDALNARTTLLTSSDIEALTEKDLITFDEREELESGMAHYRSIQKVAVNNLVSIFLSDTVDYDQTMDSVIALLGRQNCPLQQFALAELQTMHGNTSDAASALATAKNMNLSEYLDNYHNDLEDWFDIISDTTLNFEDTLTTAQISTITSLYNSSESYRVKTYTRNILRIKGEEEYSEPVYFINFENPAKGNKEPDNDELIPANELMLFPNPVDGFITFQFNGRKNISLSQYEFINVMGQCIAKGFMKSGSNVYTVPIDLPAGVYHALVTLSNQEQIISPFVVN